MVVCDFLLTIRPSETLFSDGLSIYFHYFFLKPSRSSLLIRNSSIRKLYYL